MEELEEGTLGLPQASGEHDGDVTQVADRIGEVHEVADVSAVAGQGDETFEDGRVDGDVGDVHAETEKDHERESRQKARPRSKDGRRDQGQATDGQEKARDERPSIVVDEDRQAVGGDDAQGHPQFGSGEQGGIGLGSKGCPEFRCEVGPQASDHGDEQVGEDDHAEPESMATEKGKPFGALHRGTFGSGGDVESRRGRDPVQHPGEPEKGQDEDQARREGHPGSRDALMQQFGSDRLRDAVGQDEAGAKASNKGLGHPSSFEEPQHQSEHHAQWQSVEEQAGDVPGGRHEGESEECQLSDGDQSQQHRGPALGLHFGDDPDSGELGDRVAKDLGGHEPHLRIGERRGAGVGPGGEWLPEAVHAGVSSKGGRDAPKGLDPRRGKPGRVAGGRLRTDG